MPQTNANHSSSYTGFVPYICSTAEGKELPTLTDVEGDVTGYRKRLIEYVESQNIKLRYSEKIAPQKACPLAAESRCLRECSQPRSSGSARESVTPPDLMGILILGNSG
jgi:hypothetical protein